MFCEGKGPFRWVALSGDPADILATDRAVAQLFPGNERLQRWLRLAEDRVAFQGLPARICWLGYGERDRAGLAFNDLVARGEVSAPIVIGRDHLDAGRVASPYRETEGMRDGSDAIADWPILNAQVNTAAGAHWASLHPGRGVGIGKSLHTEPVELSAQARRRVQAARAVVDAKLAAGEIVYGVTTGLGSLANVHLDPEDARLLQISLLRSHAVAVGPPLSEWETRAMLLLRAH